MVFPVVLYGCESWTIKKNECWRIVVLKKTFESSWNSKKIRPVNPKGNQLWWWSWSSNTMATWCKELTYWKRSWYRERLRARGEGNNRNEMVGWHHRLNGYEFEQAPGVGDGQGSLACCTRCGRKKSDMTSEQQTSEKSLEFGKIVLGEQLYNSASQIVTRKLGSPLCGDWAKR